MGDLIAQVPKKIERLHSFFSCCNSLQNQENSLDQVFLRLIYHKLRYDSAPDI